MTPRSTAWLSASCAIACAAIALSLQLESHAQSNPPRPGSGTASDAQAQQRSDRTTSRKRGQRLPELLTATDRLLEVVDEQPLGNGVPFGAPGTPDQGKGKVQVLTERNTLIAVVRVVSQVGRLTDGDEWVGTTLRCEIVDLRKNATGRKMVVGDLVEIASPGGVAQVGSKQIRARHYSQRLWSRGGQYLVFAVQKDGQLVAHASAWLAVDGALFVPLADGSAFDSDGVDAVDLLHEITTYALVRKE